MVRDWQVLCRVYPLPLRTTVLFTYDALHRQTSTAQEGVLQQATEYDAVGNVVASSDGLGRTTTFQYDRLDRLTTTTDPDPDGAGPQAASVGTSTYDAVGNLTSGTNGAGETESFTYDRDGRVLSSTDALGNTTHFTYDTQGNQLSYTDPNGYTTSYTYDDLSRLTAETIILAGSPVSRNYTYDQQGNLASLVDRNGRDHYYEYDDLDRLELVTSFDGAGNTHTQTWLYDALGRVTLSSDAADGVFNNQSFAYDHLGRVTEQRNYDPAGNLPSNNPRIVQRYQYDVITFSTIATVHTQHAVDSQGAETLIGTTEAVSDTRGRVIDVIDQANPATGIAAKHVDFTYNQANQLTGVTRTADGSTVFDTRYGYDNTGRVVNIAHEKAVSGQQSAFTSYQYEYDLAHRINEQTTSHDSAVPALSAVPSLETETFSFDLAGQLTGDDDGTYTYDDNGNRTDGSVVIGDHNRLLEDADYTYEYDNEGNLVERESKVDNSTVDYTWDHYNRLVGVSGFDQGQQPFSYNYHYNAQGQLVYRGETYSGIPGPVEHYVYSGNQRVLTLDDSGEVEHRYIWAPGVDQLLVDEAFNAAGSVQLNYWGATDHLGTVGELLKSDGTIVEHRQYNTFGALDEVFNQSGSATGGQFGLPNSPQSEVGYTGTFYDEQTGFTYNRERWYSPEMNRFISEDPAQDGSNWYQYAGGNSKNFRDPSGLTPAGNPLNSIAGGFSGNVFQRENTRLRNVFNPISTGLGTSSLLNPSITSGIIETPTFSSREFSSFNSLSSPSISSSLGRQSLFEPQPLPTLNDVHNFFFADESRVRAGLELQARQDAQFAVRNGTPLQALSGSLALSLDRNLSGIQAAAFQPSLEALNFAIDTTANLTGNTGFIEREFGQQQLSRTFQTFNSDPNASVGQNLLTGTLDTGAAIIQAETFKSGFDFIVDPSLENANRFGDNLFNTSLTVGGVGLGLNLKSTPTSSISPARRAAIRDALSDSNGRLLRSRQERQGIKFTIREIEKLDFELQGSIKFRGNQGIDLEFRGIGSNQGRLALAEAKSSPSRKSLKVDSQGIRQGSLAFFQSRVIRAGRFDLRDQLQAGNVDLFGGFSGSNRLFQFNPTVFQKDINFITNPNAAVQVNR